MTLYSAALGVAIAQACYATGANHERAVLKKLLGELDLEGVLIPPVSGSCHPSDLNARGLEDMTNAPLQGGR